MGSKGRKVELFFNDDQMPDFFRKLADALENIGDQVDSLPDLDDFSSMKIGIKRRFGQSIVKIKVKQENHYITKPQAEGLPAYPIKYKQLKKTNEGRLQAHNSSGLFKPDAPRDHC